MRLIDADKLIETAKKDIDHWSIKSRGSGKTETSAIKTMLALGAIEYAEQAQTVQGKRGHWIKNKSDEGYWDYSCSVCCSGHDDEMRKYLSTGKISYCPACGARME